MNNKLLVAQINIPACITLYLSVSDGSVLSVKIHEKDTAISYGRMKCDRQVATSVNKD
jgi:hypothetical protein